MNNIIDYNALLLLLLAVMGNFVAETMGCQTQKLLQNNMIIKSLIIFSLIYYTTNFTSKTIEDPKIRLYHSFRLWIGFLLFTKMNSFFTIISLILIMIVYYLDNLIKYETKNNKNKKDTEKYLRIQKILEKILIVFILIGFTLYFIKQYREHKKFSIVKFLFGVTKCQSLN
jgi:hypothetical protein